MKNTITLYKDVDFDCIMTLEDIKSGYEDKRAEYEMDGEVYPFDTVQDLIDFHVSCGDLEVITAYLSDGKTVYPFYYVGDGIGVQSIMELYTAWETMPYADRIANLPTFADFLNNPQVDRNGVPFYGFE